MVALVTGLTWRAECCSSGLAIIGTGWAVGEVCIAVARTIFVESAVLAVVCRLPASSVIVAARGAGVFISVLGSGRAIVAWLTVLRADGGAADIDCLVAIASRGTLDAVELGLGLGEGGISALGAEGDAGRLGALWAVAVRGTGHDLTIAGSGVSSTAVALGAKLAILHVMKVSAVGECSLWALRLLAARAASRANITRVTIVALVGDHASAGAEEAWRAEVESSLARHTREWGVLASGCGLCCSRSFWAVVAGWARETLVDILLADHAVSVRACRARWRRTTSASWAVGAGGARSSHVRRLFRASVAEWTSLAVSFAAGVKYVAVSSSRASHNWSTSGTVATFGTRN